MQSVYSTAPADWARWSKDEFISDVFLWNRTHGHTSVGRPSKNLQHCMETGCCLGDLSEAMNDRNGFQEKVGNFVLPPRLDCVFQVYHFQVYIILIRSSSLPFSAQLLAALLSSFPVSVVGITNQQFSYVHINLSTTTLHHPLATLRWISESKDGSMIRFNQVLLTN